MGEILSLGAAIKSIVYYQSFLKASSFSRALEYRAEFFLSNQPHLESRRIFRISPL